MSRLIDDPQEARVVAEQLIRKTSLADLLGELVPSDRSVEDLLLLEEGEEAEVDLLGDDGSLVARILVDLQQDPVNRWRLGLRGWLLANAVSSV